MDHLAHPVGSSLNTLSVLVCCIRFSYDWWSRIIIIIIVIIHFWEFFSIVVADGFSLEFEWQQVSSSLAVLSNAVIWIVSTRPPTSKSSRPFNNPFVIVPKAPITIGTIVTFMFHSFFNSLARSRYLSFFSLSFRFILWSAGTAKSTIYYNYMWSFHISFNWWFFNGIWVTASLLRSPELFPVFLRTLMLCSVCSQFFFYFPIHSVSFSNLRGLFTIFNRYHRHLHIPHFF